MSPVRTLARENQEAEALFSLLTSRLKSNYPTLDEAQLRRAYEMALTAHEGQTRMDGSPYIIHPLEVAEICVDIGMDPDAVIAAILHDTVEDTSVRLNQIRSSFGPEIASIVDSLTKIKHIDFFARFTGRNKASDQAKNLQKLFVAMTHDTRVIVIKLADRLHNMQTMASMPPHKQQRISRETLEFYIPIAKRLGLGHLSSELEDLVFQYLYPEEFDKLRRAVGQAVHEQEAKIAEMMERVTGLLRRNGIEFQGVFGRRKHLWSIFQKMQKQGVGLDSIYDLLAIRIVLKGMTLDCYRVLGLLHNEYKPIFHRFRDFIGSPKENGYQTLHTTVIGPGGVWVECQIRTVEMDVEAARGIAAHWRYKELPGVDTRLAKDPSWIDFINELTEEKVGSEEFVQRARETLLGDQVLVLSPRGEVVNLPAGSTPIDFAYYIHTDLGHAIRSAKVNGSVVSLDYSLRNGDMVEVIKSEERFPQPRPEWLVLARSSKSLIKVRKYFKALPRPERISVGRNLLRQYIVKEGLYPLNLTANDKLAALLRQLNVRNIDEIYDGVATGVYDCNDIVDKLKLIHRAKAETLLQQQPDEAELVAAGSGGVTGVGTDLGLVLQGGETIRHRCELMGCCTPVPGDRVYGVFDRPQKRTQVHRLGCPQLESQLGSGELLDLDWARTRDELRYPARVRLICLNRVGLLFEVLRELSSRKINLGGAEFMTTAHDIAQSSNVVFDLLVDVIDLVELEQCMELIRGIDDVFSVERLTKPGPGRDGHPIAA
jgi:guanosine-3',5'-bis(diphosphate) 3'-pyrophosphohydrolase